MEKKELAEKKEVFRRNFALVKVYYERLNLIRHREVQGLFLLDEFIDLKYVF